MKKDPFCWVSKRAKSAEMGGPGPVPERVGLFDTRKLQRKNAARARSDRKWKRLGKDAHADIKLKNHSS